MIINIAIITTQTLQANLLSRRFHGSGVQLEVRWVDFCIGSHQAEAKVSISGLWSYLELEGLSSILTGCWQNSALGGRNEVAVSWGLSADGLSQLLAVWPARNLKAYFMEAGKRVSV